MQLRTQDKHEKFLSSYYQYIGDFDAIFLNFWND